MKNIIDDVLVRMMDDRTSETARNLYGHSGPIYSLSFSPDRNLLLSSSEDTTSKILKKYREKFMCDFNIFLTYYVCIYTYPRENNR